mgnify:CR=1 FL=1
MKRIREIFNDDIIVRDVIKKGKCVIATINDKRYVIKDKCSDELYNIYEYLSSRNFEYFPRNITSNDKYNVYEYIEEVDNPIEQKAYDMISMLSLLHNKTTYYKEMDIDEYKEIYERISYKIESRINYYNNLISMIETTMFISPSQYLIARNISKILGALDYSRRSINEWYDLVKTRGKKRVVTLYNNIDLNHIIRNKDIYLISWDKSKIGIPIYDLYSFYLKYSNILDFKDLLKHYEERYPLLEEEKMLFNILISIPSEIEFKVEEIENCKNTKKIIDTLYRSEVIISE